LTISFAFVILTSLKYSEVDTFTMVTISPA
jgi:hypothetical protein